MQHLQTRPTSDCRQAQTPLQNEEASPLVLPVSTVAPSHSSLIRLGQ